MFSGMTPANSSKKRITVSAIAGGVLAGLWTADSNTEMSRSHKRGLSLISNWKFKTQQVTNARQDSAEQITAPLPRDYYCVTQRLLHMKFYNCFHPQLQTSPVSYFKDPDTLTIVAVGI